MDWLAVPMELVLPAVLVVGLMVGSFLNVVIHRLPLMLEREWAAQCAEARGDAVSAAAPYNLWLPRSACPNCGHAIAWYENVPVLSFLLLRGRCSACRAPISRRYPVVEILAGAMAVFTMWHFGTTWQGVAAVGLVWTLLALTFIDLDTQLLPDRITQPLLWLGLVVNVEGLFVPIEVAVVGAVAGYLTLWTVYQLFRLLTGKEGMGFGDFKLLAALGAWLGWTMLPLIILLSSLLGAAIGIVLILFAGRDRAQPIPYGPYLAAAGTIALFWGKPIVSAYLVP